MGNVFTKLQPSNDGGGDTHTDTEDDNLISLVLLLFQKYRMDFPMHTQ
jgi:hypothetical protein